MSAPEPALSPCAGRVGVLGGTFNPVHVGHIRLALEVAEAMALSRVDLLPCANPPHKPAHGLLPYATRLAMLRAAARGEARLGVSALEGELPQPSYTWNTARAWTERYGAAPLFILGDEDFAGLDGWRHGLELPEVMDMVVVPRSGAQSELFLRSVQRFRPGAELFPEPGQPGVLRAVMAAGRACWFLPVPRLEISATVIRERWLRALNIRYLVPDGVLAVLREQEAAVRAVWAEQ